MTLWTKVIIQAEIWLVSIVNASILWWFYRLETWSLMISIIIRLKSNIYYVIIRRNYLSNDKHLFIESGMVI